MKQTNNFKFNKPEPHDFYDVDVQNQNWDKVDAELNFKELVGGNSLFWDGDTTGCETITNPPFTSKYTTYYKVSDILLDGSVFRYGHMCKLKDGSVHVGDINFYEGDVIYSVDECFIATLSHGSCLNVSGGIYVCGDLRELSIYGFDGFDDFKKQQIKKELLPISYGLHDLVEGETPLATGSIYFVYE